MGNLEENIAANMAKIETVVTTETHMTNTQATVATNVENIETQMANFERKMERNTTDMEGKTRGC